MITLPEFFQTFLFWFKIASAVISAILLFVVVRLIIVTDAFGGYRKYRLDVRKYGAEEKKRTPDMWKRVLKFVQSPKPEDWKQAVLVADQIFDDVLKIGGYTGATTAERIEKVEASQIGNIDRLRVLRANVFSSIHTDEALDLPVVKELLREYREVFQTMGYL